MNKIFAFLMTAAALVACSRAEQPEVVEQPEAPVTYTMTVKATKEVGTRLLELGGQENKTLFAKWSENDHVHVYDNNGILGTLFPVEISDDGASCILSGDLDDAPTGNTVTLKYLAQNYTWQDGTLAYISNNCDSATAVVDVMVNGNTISASNASFENHQAVIKFTLQDKGNSNAPISPSELTISDGDGTSTSTITISLTGIPDDTYTKNGAGVLFVAFPGSDDPQTINLTARVGDEIYYLSRDNVTFNNGQYYAITAKMTKYGIQVTNGNTRVPPESFSAATGTGEYSLGGYYNVTGTGKADITTTSVGALTLFPGVNITGYLNFNKLTSIRFDQSDAIYRINNPGETAINGILNIRNEEEEGPKPTLYIDGDIVYTGNSDNNSGIGNTVVFINGSIIKNSISSEFFINEGADVYVEGNITGTFNLAAGAYLRVKGTVISVKNSYNEEVVCTTDNGYKVYHYDSLMPRIDVGSGIFMYYVKDEYNENENETWAQAIDNHPEKNGGWGYNDEYVYWTDGEELYLVLYNFPEMDTKINPFEPISDGGWYALESQESPGGDEPGGDDPSGLLSLAIIIYEGGSATIKYEDGETWWEAISSHNENGSWSIDEDYVYYGELRLTHPAEFDDSMPGDFVSPNEEISSNSSYYILASD